MIAITAPRPACLAAAMLACLISPPSGASAKDALTPLASIVEGGAQISTVALHCAGLFHSVWDFGSDLRLDAENAALAKSNTTLFLDAGLTLRAGETGQSEASLRAQAVAEAFAVSTLYHRHYTANVTAGREPYADDKIWNEDLDVCRNLNAQF